MNEWHEMGWYDIEREGGDPTQYTDEEIEDLGREQFCTACGDEIRGRRAVLVKLDSTKVLKAGPHAFHGRCADRIMARTFGLWGNSSPNAHEKVREP
jgi:hypothetical protein